MGSEVGWKQRYRDRLWLEKPERIAAFAMLTVVRLLVYAVIQRQVRLYLRDRDQQIPGNKGPTATPTATVVFALFTLVMLVQLAVDELCSLQVHGVQDYHPIVCEAVGIDQAWYQEAATGQIRCRGPHPLQRGVKGQGHPSGLTCVPSGASINSTCTSTWQRMKSW